MRSLRGPPPTPRPKRCVMWDQHSLRLFREEHPKIAQAFKLGKRVGMSAQVPKGRSKPRILTAQNDLHAIRISPFEISNLIFGNSSHDLAINDFALPPPGRSPSEQDSAFLLVLCARPPNRFPNHRSAFDKGGWRRRRRVSATFNFQLSTSNPRNGLHHVTHVTLVRLRRENAFAPIIAIDDMVDRSWILDP
jgi:hypothetical protein